jgi:hypothetical protein
MLNPIRIQMLQLNLVIVEEPQEEAVGRRHKPAIVEVRERHHVAVRRRREVVAIRYYPLVCGGPLTKKTTVDKALYGRMATI